MGIGGPGGVTVKSIAPVVLKAKAAPRVKKPKAAPVERRMSSRQQAQKDDGMRDEDGNLLSEEELERLREKEEEEERLAEAEKKRARHAKRVIAANTSIALCGTTATLNALLTDLANFAVDRKPAVGGKRRASEELSGSFLSLEVPKPRSMSPKSGQEADDRLEASLSKLVLRGITKVVPERVYSLVVHPSTTKDLVFVGDKIGNVGLWDATDAGKPTQAKGKGKAIQSSEKPETHMGTTWSWPAHERNSVSCLKISPAQPTSVRSTPLLQRCVARADAYRSGRSTRRRTTVRFDEWSLKLKFPKKWSILRNYRATSVSYPASISRLMEIRFGVSPRRIFLHDVSKTDEVSPFAASDNGGGITHRDLRQKIGTSQRWTVDKAKLGCISLNPANQNLAVTSHNSREIRFGPFSCELESC